MPSPTPTIIYLFIFIFIFILFFENINIYLYILTQDIFHISQVFFQMVKISQSHYICSNCYHIHIYYIHNILYNTCIIERLKLFFGLLNDLE
jgi:hypothetical protein